MFNSMQFKVLIFGEFRERTSTLFVYCHSPLINYIPTWIRGLRSALVCMKEWKKWLSGRWPRGRHCCLTMAMPGCLIQKMPFPFHLVLFSSSTLRPPMLWIITWMLVIYWHYLCWLATNSSLAHKESLVAFTCGHYWNCIWSLYFVQPLVPF